jgi:tryptophanyl-tRNA synthetase
MTQFKDKSGKNKEGTRTRPILPSPDPPDVASTTRRTSPSARDQKQRHQARRRSVRFNNDFDVELFTAPSRSSAAAPRHASVVSLRDGSMKMSVRPVGHEPHQSHRR